MGWDDDPHYSPPNPPRWIWLLLASVLGLILLAAVADQLRWGY